MHPTTFSRSPPLPPPPPAAAATATTADGPSAGAAQLSNSSPPPRPVSSTALVGKRHCQLSSPFPPAPTPPTHTHTTSPHPANPTPPTPPHPTPPHPTRRSIEFRLRVPGVDLWTTHKPLEAEVWLMFMLLGAGGCAGSQV